MSGNNPRVKEQGGHGPPEEEALGRSPQASSSVVRELTKLSGKLNAEAPRTSGSHLFNLLNLCKVSSGKAWAKICLFAVWGADRLTDRESKLVLAKAQAEAQLIAVRAEAKKTEAEAAKILADADVVRAQGLANAAVTQAEISRRDELLRELKARGFDWRGEFQDGVLRIVVTKRGRKRTGSEGE